MIFFNKKVYCLICNKHLISKYPSSIFLWNILGASNARLNKLNESEKCFYTSIKLNPNFIEGHYNLGKTQKELGKLTEAISSYKKAIEIKPDYAEFYNEIGGAQIELGKISEGVSNYKKAIEINPNFVKAYNNYTDSVKIQINELKESKFIEKELLNSNSSFIILKID